jgi:RNase P subunit RPR2
MSGQFCDSCGLKLILGVTAEFESEEEGSAVVCINCGHINKPEVDLTWLIDDKIQEALRKRDSAENDS